MKKLIAALTLLLAFTINANAQDKKSSTPADKGLKEATELSQFLGLNDTQKADFARLFEMKHKTMTETALSEERKKELARVIEAKIRASLDGNQMDKLEKNTELFKKLVN
ncbi:hypothetical protein [Flavobacterium sedimenticola]|uniref:DUF4890 domain-containing protein n=1 Tax=Flavobacterium sedimenticola TaxID=3043286 RepID=A0ABT6XR20_9FLAO|nr:hypothetical protein [Flavobacterium sedimenticola]MDI9257506.1 hypothetical protein [Flavobacterium sedimenticola]